MPAWFDIYSLDRSGQQDEPGILKAAESGMCWIGPCRFIVSHQPLTRFGLGGWSLFISHYSEVFLSRA